MRNFKQDKNKTQNQEKKAQTQKPKLAAADPAVQAKAQQNQKRGKKV